MDKRKFNFKLFTRLVRYVKPYKLNFLFVSFAAVLISFFSIFNQYLLKIAVDDFITPKDYEGLVTIISVLFISDSGLPLPILSSISSYLT